jgi:demethylmenaquinone methyltransferase/2-methoxy-6-polyprenyl-1,4-benzoquinol methylase
VSPETRERNPVPGARPEGARDESEAARQVREMFSRIAPRYDFLNHLLSLDLDRVWRRRVAELFGHILGRTEARALDLCCGTGDLTLALERAGRATIFGTDFAHPMLVRAREKAAREGRAASGAYVEADALRLPFADSSFDLATVAFGFRNLANYERGLREMHRVLRPGGEVGILEFAEPRGAVLGRLYRFYFTKIIPRLGGAISGNATAYSYLPSSVAEFPQPEELAAMMSCAGLENIRFELWTIGSVALHTARRA